MTEISKQSPKTGPILKDGRPASPLRWYFVCSTCNAKWFHIHREHPCPRCGAPVAAKERLIPPWQRNQQAPLKQPTPRRDEIQK